VGLRLPFSRAALVLAAVLAWPGAALAVTGAPTGLTATTPTRAKPVLSWTAPASVGAGIAGYNVYRGATRANGAVIPAATTTYTDSGAAANGTLSYTVKAVETGTNLESAASSAFAVVYDTTAPTAPTGVSAATPTGTSPTLTWTAGTDALAGVRWYQVLRGTTVLGTTTSLTYTDASVTTAGSYAYSVKTEDWAGNVSGAGAKTVLYDNLPPSTPAGFNPPAAQRTKPTMSWTAATDTGGAGILRYDVYRAGTPNVLAGSATTTSFTDASIAVEGAYPYFVVAVDKAGNGGPPTAVKTITYDTTPPTVPTGLQASASPTSAKPALAFTAATDTGGTGVVSYRLYRNGTSVATAAGTTAVDSALATDGTYSYTVTAIDAAGNESAVSSAVTVVYDKTVPPAPTSLTAAATPTNAKPALTWTSGGADALSGFARYDVYRGTALAGSTTATSFTDSALSTSGSYSYTVKAVDNAGNVSNASAAKVVVYDVIAPPVPGGLTAPAATKVKPTLTFTAAGDTGGSGTDHYDVYRDGALLGVTLTTSYTETSATYPDGSYSYSVSAVDKAGNEGPQTVTKVVVYDTTPPVAPATPTTSAPVTKLKPAISWSAATDPGGSGVTSYAIYRDGVQIAAAAVGSSYQDTALSANGTYAYAIRANDAAGNASPLTATVSITYDTVAPPVPAGLTGPTPTGANPSLTWTSGGPDTLSGLDHYEIQRSGTTIGSSPTTSFTHVGAASGSNVYTVKAVDAAGNVSAASAAKTIVYDTTPPGTPTNIAATSPTNLPSLSWTAATDVSGINRYEVYRDGSLIGSTTLTSFVDTPAPAEGSYAYTVAAFDNAGNGGTPSTPKIVVVDATPPPAPTALAGPSPTSAKPILNWASGGPDNGSGFARYNVYRNGALAGTATGTTFTDSALTVNGSSSYTVRAVDVAGNESTASAALAVVWDNVPPPVPTGLNGAGVVTSTPHLDWFSGGPDGLSGFDHYDVYRAGIKVGQASSPTFDDAGVTIDGSYVYTVKAVDAAGNASGASNAITVLRDTTPPSVPQVTAAPTPIRTQPALTWASATDGSGSGVVRYDVYRDGALVASTATTTYTDDAALADGVYAYTVRAADLAGNVSSSSLSAAIRIDRVPPDPPTGLTAATPTNLPHLTWTQASDAATGGSGIASYRVYRNGVRVGIVGVADFQDSTVALDDAYDYTVTAVDGAGNESAPSSAVTVLFDHTPPPPPTGLNGPTPSQAKPDMTWASGGADALSGFAFYEISRDGGVVGTTTSPAFTDTALPANGSYVYTVRAVDYAGNRSLASPLKALIWDTTPPATPAGLGATTPTPHPVVTWTPSSDTGGAGTDHYVIVRDGSPVGSSPTATYADGDGTLPEGIHTYAAQAVDGAGNASAVSDPVVVTVDRTPPDTPLNVAAVSPTPRPVVTWDVANDTGPYPTGVDHYDVYRGATKVGSTAGTSFQDDLVTLDGSYAYTVRTVDRAGNASAATPPVTVIFDKTPPPQATNLSAPSPTPDAPVISWMSGGIDNLSGFARYDVYRDGSLISSTTTPGFTDTTLSAQGAHVYVVRTVDAAGNAAAASNPLTVIYDTTPPPPPTGLIIPTPTRLPHLTWDAGQDDDTGASGLDHYDVYRDGLLVGRSSTTSFDDATVALNGSYGYSLTAVDRAGNESLRSRTVIIRYDGTPPLPPLNPNGATPTRLPTFTWVPASDQTTGGSAITSYRVYRNGVFVGETSATSFTDAHAVDSGHAIYTVRALDAAGNVSGPSIGLDLVVDLDGPILDGIVIPAQRSVGTAVDFQVSPRDALSGVLGVATWDFGDGLATGNKVSHVFSAAGTYVISVRAEDILGNTTVVTNRAIRIITPPGGVPPTVLRLGPIKNIRLKTLKRRGSLTLSVYTNVNAPLEFTIERAGAVVLTRVKRMPAGSSKLVITLPKQARRKGRFKVTVKAVSTALKASRQFRVR
jgi:fibronectin type 3 domain-containing protein